MVDRGTALKIYCISCHRDTKHIVKGTWTRPSGHDPFPVFEAQVLKKSVEAFFESLQWPYPPAGWNWLFSTEERSPEEDLQGAIKDLDAWLDADAVLQQDLWFEEFTTWNLLRQGWRWIDVLYTCQFGLEWVERWEIVECCGCGAPSFHLCKWSEIDDVRDPETGRVLEPRVEQTVRFPPVETLSEPAWPIPEWIWELPEDISRLLEESYKALNEGFLTVGSMGMRSVVELVMAEFVGDKGNFSEKLQRGFEQRLITAEDKSALGAVIQSGHAAVHRRHSPTVEEVQIVINVAEMFLHRQFLIPKQVELLRRRTPPRTPPKKIIE
jgi:hypothetical protein